MNEIPQPVTPDPPPDRPFGRENRERLLTHYVEHAEDVTIEGAWKHLYRLFMWIDGSIGLAHCYESDKCQPGRPWHGRALAFHAWLASEFGVAPVDLADHLDWMFDRVLEDNERTIEERNKLRMARYAEQRDEHPSAPKPGADPKLTRIIVNPLRPWLTGDPDDETVANMQSRVIDHVTRDSSRKNLLGEGFEDALAVIINALSPDGVQAKSGVPLDDIPGFHPPRPNEKGRVVDLVVLSNDPSSSLGVRRMLVSCKWSVRSDREEQFYNDFSDYTRLEAAGERFEYVLVTNEFDAARLKAAATATVNNAALFDGVVHVTTDGVLAAWNGSPRPTPSEKVVRPLIGSGRVSSVTDWLQGLT